MLYSIHEVMADGYTDTFPVPFPYIAKEHVTITVNGIFAWAEWVTPGSVKITPTPADGAFVKIERNSHPESRLVDFEDGSNLTADIMDLSATQIFYMAQEVMDKYTRLVEAGLTVATGDGIITIPPNSLLDQIVADTISGPLYASLSEKVGELDTLAELTLQEALRSESTINELRVQLDELGTHYAMIVEEQTVRLSETGALASQMSTVTTTVNGNTASIQQQSLSINGLSAQYTVKIDVNGYVAGYGLASYLNNDGAHTSDFVVLADTFSIVKPGALPGETPIVPFVVGSSYGASTVGINGQLIVNGTIYADAVAANTITANKLNVVDLSAISANLGDITTGQITFNYPADGGRYMQMNTFSDYPIWFGAGTKNDANATFYIKKDGSAKFSGALSAGSNFTVDADGNMNAKSVVLRDALNNVILSSVTGMEWSYVTGVGRPDSWATYGATIGTNLYGQMSRANISTYIANAAMHTALIEDLAVNTFKIAGNAITIPSSVYYPGSMAATGGWDEVASLSLPEQTAPYKLIIITSCAFVCYQAPYNTATCAGRILVNGVEECSSIWGTQYNTFGATGSPVISKDIPAYTAVTIQLQTIMAGVTSGTMSNRSISAIGAKK